MKIKFISHKGSKEIRTMYTKSSNIKIMKGDKTDGIIEQLFVQNYQHLLYKIIK